MKTNAMRQLDALKIPYQIKHYAVDENKLSAFHVAESIGLETAQCFKSLVTLNAHHELFMAVIPGDAQLDLKALARILQQKKLNLLPLNELQKRTGYIRGGVSPLGLKQQLPIILDEMAKAFDFISISAGQRGLQILIDPQDLWQSCPAQWGEICLY